MHPSFSKNIASGYLWLLKGLNMSVFRIILSMLFFCGCVIFLYFSIHLLYLKPIKSPVIFVVDRHETARQVSKRLQAENLISSEFVFRAALKITNTDKKIRAGVYQFLPDLSLLSLLKMLTRDSGVLLKITIPEGWTTVQIINYLSEIQGIEKSLSLERESQRYFLPETYYFYPPISEDKVLEMMVNQAQKRIKNISAGLLPFPLKTFEEVVTLAAIIEKETALDWEKPIIAGVFLNRLRKGIPLQADPTVAYAVSQGTGMLNRSLTRLDLKFPSPYNTYLNKGLPPGPICHPGWKSIEAVLKPQQSTLLYFVKNSEGGHTFAQTIKAHNQNVKKYRLLSIVK